MNSQIAYCIFFYGFAAASVLLALVTVHTQGMVRAAVALMGVLAITAGFYVLLGAEFLAGVQVLVYVGGIVVLIVFAVMLTRSANLQDEPPPELRRRVAAAISIVFLISTMIALKESQLPVRPDSAPVASDTAAIGTQLLDYGATGYVLPFEIISLLLLAAVLGGIVIARKTAPKDQPFTSGGDLPGEADRLLPLSQDDADSASALAGRQS